MKPMQRTFRPHVIVPAAVLLATVLSACEDDPIPPVAPSDPASEQAPEQEPEQSPEPAPDADAGAPATGEEEPAGSSSGASPGEARSDDPAVTAIDDVRWTEWELLRRNADVPVPDPGYYEHSQAGAEAALNHILAVEVYTYNTLNLEPWREISAESCGSCASLVTERERWAIEGTYDENYLFEEEEREIVQEGDEPNWTFTATGNEPARTIVDSEGGYIEQLPASRVEFLYDVSWTGEGWQVEELAVTVL